VTELVNLIIDFGVFFDVRIGLRQVGFRLIVVVVANEVLYRVAGEELLELLYNWAARVLLWLMINAGRRVRAITLAMVNVLPLPVTPSSVWYR
jgi:hypothetical protein